MELHRGNHFLRLTIRSSWIQFQLGSSAQIFKVLAFEAILFIFSGMKLSLKLSLKLVEFKWEKVIILRLLKNVKNFVNGTSIESCFGMPTFYIGFCYYQLNQYGCYYPCEAVLFQVESEVLLNLDIVMKKKLVLYHPLLK